jgi:uncharacterized damage-inducible protein DinB
MLIMLQDLIEHKVWANNTLLEAIRGHEASARDPELRGLLHHIVLANRFWLALSLGLPFAEEEEKQVPESLKGIEAKYRETHSQELHWISAITEADLGRKLESPLIPNFSCSVEQALMQICMHSQGHRVQCAARLRQLGGMPPQTDFIHWVRVQPTSRRPSAR